MMRKLIIAAGLLSGGLIFGSGVWMGGKAVLAQHLLEGAWDQSVETQTPVQPWKSMDARPMAKLSVPALDKSVIVFDRASGQALAFGPGHMPETAPIGANGTAAIAAHKNTHFAFLKGLSSGMTFTVELVSGEVQTYRVTGTEIINTDTHSFTIPSDPNARSELALITCYPFDAVSFGGPLRYIVTGERV